MDKSFIIPAVIIYQGNFQKIKLIDLDTNSKSDESLNHIENEFKKIVEYRWGNQHRFLQIISGGHLFVFSVYFQTTKNPNKQIWNVTIWNDSGGIGVTSANFPVVDKENDTIPTDIFHKLIQDCCDYSNNIYKCSGCGNKMNKIAGQYFAGIYCQKCWDSKYKAMEVRETYD